MEEMKITQEYAQTEEFKNLSKEEKKALGFRNYFGKWKLVEPKDEKSELLGIESDNENVKVEPISNEKKEELKSNIQKTIETAEKKVRTSESLSDEEKKGMIEITGDELKLAMRKKMAEINRIKKYVPRKSQTNISIRKKPSKMLLQNGYGYGVQNYYGTLSGLY